MSPLNQPISTIMTTPVTTVRDDTSLREASEVFTAGDVTGMPVLNASGDVVGVVSLSDVIARVGSPRLPAPDNPADAEMAATLAHILDDEALDGTTVAHVMSREVVRLNAAASVKEAAATMASERVHRVLVDIDGKLAGIVSSMDVLEAIGR